MISASDALKIVKQSQFPTVTQDVPLENSLGYVLAEDITADRQYPPFDRAMMDGVAIRSDGESSQGKPRTRWALHGVQAAGMASITGDYDSSIAIEIMTGASVGEAFDTIIPYEDCIVSAEEIRLKSSSTYRPGQFIQRRGSDCKAGERLVGRGVKIGPEHLGLFATMGYTEVLVYTKPSVALITTGDEVVAADRVPDAYQIRGSHRYALGAALRAAGFELNGQFHVKDSFEEVFEVTRKAINDYDFVLICGGVSKGRFDYVPEVLSDLGVNRCFHGVFQKPGKPLFFGKTADTAVFGLPGNPNSAYFSVQAFVLPALRNFAKQAVRRPLLATLKTGVLGHDRLQRWLPVQLSYEDQRVYAEVLTLNSSGDNVSLARSQGLLPLPPGKNFMAGKQVEVFPYQDLYAY